MQAMDALIFSTGWRSPPSRTLTDHWTQYAVPLLLSMFSVELGGRRFFGTLAFLPDMLARTSESSALLLCAHAVSFAFLAHKAATWESAAVRDQAYGHALAATNALVGDSTLRLEDETSVCVWLLSLYEVIRLRRSCSAYANKWKVIFGSNPSTLGPGAVTVHAHGLLNLLRLRGPDQLQTEAGRGIFWLLATSTQIMSLISGTRYPAFTQTWLDDFRSTNPDCDTYLFQLNIFAGRATSVAAQARQSQQPQGPMSDLPSVTELWTQVQALETELNLALQEQRVEEPINLQKLFLNNQYRAYYVRTLQIVQDSVRSNDIKGNDISYYNKISTILGQISTGIQSSTDAILENVFCILGPTSGMSLPATSDFSTGWTLERPVCWADVFRLVWPLRTVILRSSILSELQLQNVQSALQYIGTKYCLRTAVAPYPSEYPDLG